jgi:pyridoxal phosphate enzyme (YggS family)
MDAGQELIIKENIEKVKGRILQAAKRAGRDGSEIKLVAVTKQKSAALVKALIENGIRKIGESYLQEARFKIDLLSDLDIEWHMIGNIQRGKEKHVASIFDVVHSVGGLRTARELNNAAVARDKVIPVYLELNISGESTKHGWKVVSADDLEELSKEFEEIEDYVNLKVLGLMTMAPYFADPEESRPYFKQMRVVRDQLVKRNPRLPINELSMGMSGDFEVAIEEGATIVRIGSALVGHR